MSNAVKVKISPAAILLLAAFVWLSSLRLLAAILLAALCHELGHYLVLRRLGGRLSGVSITALGAEMRMAPGSRLSYGEELLATAAGPGTNLLLSLLLAFLGRRAPTCYLWSGVNLMLGLFNLLPITPLDGGSMLWLGAAWMTEPYTADRVAENVGLAVSAVLLALTIRWSIASGGGGVFLILMALWLFVGSMKRKWSTA